MTLESHKISVSHITAAQTIEIRHRVLRPGKPIESCDFEGDNWPTTFHLGLFIDGTLVGIASFLENSRTEKTNEIQLRGMAILPEWQGKNLGQHLIKKAEEIAISKSIQTIWCNVRVHAQNFYKKMNFKTLGTPFDIPQVGPHIIMEKELKP